MGITVRTPISIASSAGPAVVAAAMWLSGCIGEAPYMPEPEVTEAPSAWESPETLAQSFVVGMGFPAIMTDIPRYQSRDWEILSRELSLHSVSILRRAKKDVPAAEKAKERDLLDRFAELVTTENGQRVWEDVRAYYSKTTGEPHAAFDQLTPEEKSKYFAKFRDPENGLYWQYVKSDTLELERALDELAFCGAEPACELPDNAADLLKRTQALAVRAISFGTGSDAGLAASWMVRDFQRALMRKLHLHDFERTIYVRIDPAHF